MMGEIKAAQELLMRYAASAREYLSEWYLKVESNFAGLKTWTDSHLRGDVGYRHNADDVDYSGSIPQGNTVKEVLEDTYDALSQEKQDRITEDDAIRRELQAEAAERKTEDSKLNAALDAETAERESADTALRTALETETRERADADIVLQTALDVYNTEIRTAIAEEVSKRTNADTDLQAAIAAEALARESCDAEILQELRNMETSRELFSAMNKECAVIYQILGIECIDGGLFWDAQNDEVLDGGIFEEESTEESDFGDFSVPHIAAQVSVNIDGGQFE